MNKLRVLAMACLASSAGLAMSTSAQEHHDLRGPRVELDMRYHHDRYYPARGYVMTRLPPGSVSIAFGPGRYYFHAGVWFRPVGAGFEVITPPIGIVISALPPGYATVVIGGVPYYYANDVYYAAAPNSGYVVVAPPPGAESAMPLDAPAPPVVSAQAGTPAPMAVPAAAAPPEPVVYPRSGQSVAQTDSDKQQCRQWAQAQPGAASDASVYQRAMAACLDGRGYTVR